MKLFENKVGRPSNETLKKRRIVATVLIFVAVFAIGACVFYTVNHFKTVGSSKNISTAFSTYQLLSSSIDMTDSKGNTYPKSTYAELKNGTTYYLVDMKSTATLKIKVKYGDNIIAGKTVNKKKYYYQMQVVAYAAGDKKIASTGKTNIKSTVITQSLSVKNTVSYVRILIYDASSSRKVVETITFNVRAKDSSANLNKVFKDPTLKSCVLSAYNKEFNTSKVDLTNSEIAKITKLDCSRSKLSGYIQNSTGLEKMTSLSKLYLDGNKLSTINLKKNVNLTELNISNNNLTSINLTKNTKLVALFIKGNNLKSLNLSKNTKLTQLSTDVPNKKINFGNNKVILAD